MEIERSFINKRLVISRPNISSRVNPALIPSVILSDAADAHLFDERFRLSRRDHLVAMDGNHVSQFHADVVAKANPYQPALQTALQLPDR